MNYRIRQGGHTSPKLGKALSDGISRRLFKPLDIPRCFSITFMPEFYSTRFSSPLTPTLYAPRLSPLSSLDRDLGQRSGFALPQASGIAEALHCASTRRSLKLTASSHNAGAPRALSNSGFNCGGSRLHLLHSCFEFNVSCHLFAA